MPVFKSGKGLAPAWCEMEYFEILKLRHGESRAFDRCGQKEKLFIGRGRCRVTIQGESWTTKEGNAFELNQAGGRFEVNEASSEVVLVRLCGRWGEPTGGCGVFGLDNSAAPQNIGDPVDYARTTYFDNHYHDCDEYWVVFEGRGLAVSEGKFYDVGPGDCVATGMGHHHDFPRVFAPIKGVYFETTLERRKRSGHLWNHTHGLAEPRADRV